MNHSSLNVFITNNMPSGTKSITKVPLSRQCPKGFLSSFFYFFFFLKWASSKLPEKPADVISEVLNSKLFLCFVWVIGCFIASVYSLVTPLL